MRENSISRSIVAKLKNETATQNKADTYTGRTVRLEVLVADLKIEKISKIIKSSKNHQ